MSDVPQGRNTTIKPLLVAIESEAASGQFNADPRCAVRELTFACDGKPSAATIEVFGGPIYAIRGRTAEDALSPAGFLNGDVRPAVGKFITPDQKIAVYLESNGVRNYIFSGYCDVPDYRDDGGGKEYLLYVESVLKRLADANYAQIIGRYERTAEGQDDLDWAQTRANTTPIGNETSVARVMAAPCVFNAGGRGNRAAAPITIALGDRQILVHVFCADGDPDGKVWTVAQALRHVMLFQVFATQSGGHIDDLAGLLYDGNLFDITDAFATQEVTNRPAAPPLSEDLLKYCMLGRCSVSGERKTSPEVFALVAEASGLHYRVETATEDGVPVDRLYWWARGGGTVKQFRREGQIAGDTAAQILAKNDAGGIRVRADYSDVLPNPLIVGDIQEWEITTVTASAPTIGLLPGWLPLSGSPLDNVASAMVKNRFDYATAHFNLAVDPLTDDYCQKFTKTGVHFPEFRDQGRRWILNETGRYRASAYARSIGPFTAAVYVPWEPSDCGIKEQYLDDDGNLQERAVEAGAWARRGRPFRDCLSADPQRRSLGVYVEMSVDGGVNWYRLDATLYALADEAGIYIDADDLTLVTIPGDDATQEDKSLWSAYLYGLLRIRVTACIRGDGRIMPNLNASDYGAPFVGSASRGFHVAERFHWASRQLANSIFRDETVPPGSKAVSYETADRRNDLGALQDYSLALLDTLVRRQTPALITIPWFSMDYRVGDCVSGISGLGIELWNSAMVGQQRYPDVVCVVCDARRTRVALEDRRLIDLEVG